MKYGILVPTLSGVSLSTVAVMVELTSTQYVCLSPVCIMLRFVLVTVLFYPCLTLHV